MRGAQIFKDQHRAIRVIFPADELSHERLLQLRVDATLLPQRLARVWRRAQLDEYGVAILQCHPPPFRCGVAARYSPQRCYLCAE